MRMVVDEARLIKENLAVTVAEGRQHRGTRALRVIVLSYCSPSRFCIGQQCNIPKKYTYIFLPF